MAKKDTTGGPVRRRRDPELDDSSYLSRAERESRAQKWLLLAVAVTLGVMLVILLGGIIYEGLIYPNQAVASVDDTSVSTTAFEQRVRYERWALGRQLQNIAAVYGSQTLFDENSPFYQQFLQLQPGQDYIMGRQARDAMVEEILIRKAADELGITVTDEEVEARVQTYFGYDPNPEPEEPVGEDAASEEDADADTDPEEDADTEAEEDTDAEADVEEDTDADADDEEAAASEEDADADAEDADTDAEEDTDADADAEETAASEEDADADAEEDTDADADDEETAASEEDADADAEDADTEAESTPLPTLTPAPTVPPPPTLTPEELADRYEEVSTDYFAEAVEISGMSEADIRAIFAVDVLREKLQVEVVDEVATTEEQINARHILVETEEEAQEVMAALDEGQAFEDLAVELSIDPSAAQNSGELGWAGTGTYVPEFEAAIWAGEIGEISEPVQTQFGYHIIEVLGREDRELTESEIAQRESGAFSTWLQEQRLAATIEYPNDYLQRTPGDPTIYDMNLVGTASQ